MTITKNDDPEKMPRALLKEFASNLDDKDKEYKDRIIKIGQALKTEGVPMDKVGVVLDDYLKKIVDKQTGERVFTRTWLRRRTPQKWWSS